jgi:hypothetical protein
MQTSHVSTSADPSTGTGCDAGIGTSFVAVPLPYMAQQEFDYVAVPWRRLRVTDYSTFLTGHT